LAKISHNIQEYFQASHDKIFKAIGLLCSNSEADGKKKTLEINVEVASY
jgi:hypothetical protein